MICTSCATRRTGPRLLATAALTLLVALAGGCAGQRPAATPNFYRFDTGWLDSLPAAEPPAQVGVPGPRSAPPAAASTMAAMRPTLIVNPVQAAAGYDSAHIVYQRVPSRQERFAYSEWVDTPARMLTPALMATLARSGAFRAVVTTPSAAAGDLRLDVEIVQLVQDFSTQPSRARLALHAYVVDDATRRVLAWRDIRVEAAAPSDDPAGGVAAASQAVRQALQQLSGFCAEAARDWRPATAVATAPAR